VEEGEELSEAGRRGVAAAERRTMTRDGGRTRRGTGRRRGLGGKCDALGAALRN
jgi:hypothetical protein